MLIFILVSVIMMNKVMLRVIMLFTIWLNLITPSVILLGVIMVKVKAPIFGHLLQFNVFCRRKIKLSEIKVRSYKT